MFELLEIDFSVAPEDATHFHDSGDAIWWYKEASRENMWKVYRGGGMGGCI